MSKTSMTPKMEQLLKVVRNTSVAGNRGCLTGRMLDLDRAPWVHSAQALIRRGKLARTAYDGTTLWIAL